MFPYSHAEAKKYSNEYNEHDRQRTSPLGYLLVYSYGHIRPFSFKSPFFTLLRICTGLPL